MNVSLLYNVFMGEISPLLASRVDSPAHQMGAKRMENFIPMLTGGLRKRPGTFFDGTTHENKEARLIEWLVSDGSCLILEVTEGTIRIWKDQGDNDYQIIQTLNSPYTAEQIQKLHYAASADDLWIVHPEQSPMKLAWNENQINLAITIEGDFIGKDFTAENDRPSCVAFESGRLCLAGTNNEPNRIYMSRAPDSQTGSNRHTDFTTEERYTTIRETSSIARDEDGNEVTEPVLDEFENQVYTDNELAFNINAKEFVFYNRTYFKDYTYESGSINSGILLGYLRRFDIYERINHEGSYIESWVGSLEYCVYPLLFELHVIIGKGILSNLYKFSPYYCMEGTDTSTYADSSWYKYDYHGKPVTKPKYETKTEETANISITPSHAIVLEENDMHGSRLQWIASGKHFFSGTDKSTWSDNGEVPTPATFDMNIVEYTGANNLQPKGTKEIMVYAGRDGKTLRALVWNQNSQYSGYSDMDISAQAGHLFTAGIKDFAVMDYPYPMIWAVTNAGELVSCLIDVRAGMIAFSKHPTDGFVESIAAASQKSGDAIFLTVKRGEERNVEHFMFEDLINADYSESHYVDAGEAREFAEPTSTIAGLERFEGKTIRVFADGAIEPPVVVENGTVELQHKAEAVHLGLPYKAAFTPNTRQIPVNGTSVGKKRRIEKITLQLFKTLGGKAGTEEEKSEEIITKRYGEYELGSAPEPFTGEYDIMTAGNIDTEGKLVIAHEEPCPFTLLALVERVGILEA